MVRVRASHFLFRYIRSFEPTSRRRTLKIRCRARPANPALAPGANAHSGSEKSSSRSGRRTRRGITIGSAVGLAALAVVWVDLNRPLPEIPVAADLEQLEPQLRIYISEKVQWVREAPRDMRRHATLGIVYAANSLWREARLAFGNAARINPKEPLALMYVGVSAHELGEFEEALGIFKQLTGQFPKFAPGYYRLGHALLRAGAVDEAESAFRKLIDLAPYEWRGYAGLGDTSLRKGASAEAAKWLEKAVEVDPTAKIAHHLLGTAYRSLGRMADARLELSLGLNAIVLPMSDAWSESASEHMKLLQDQIEIADGFSRAGQANKAIELLQEALRFHPENLSLLNNLGIALNRSGQPGRARSILVRALQINSNSLPAMIALSFTCQMLNSNEEALAFAERAIAMSSNTAQAHVAKANALLAMERDLDAVAALEAAFKCDPQNAEIQIELGDVRWRNLHRPAEALGHYKKAVELVPSLVPVHQRLAEFHLERRDRDEARAAIDMIRRLSPSDPSLAVLEGRFRKLKSP